MVNNAEQHEVLGNTIHIQETKKLVAVPVQELATVPGAEYWGVSHRKIDTLIVRLLKNLEAGTRQREAQMVMGLLTTIFLDKFQIPLLEFLGEAQGFSQWARSKDSYPMSHPYLVEGLALQWVGQDQAIRPDNINKAAIHMMEQYQDYQPEEALIGTMVVLNHLGSPTESLQLGDAFLHGRDEMLEVISTERFIHTYYKDFAPRFEKVELKNTRSVSLAGTPTNPNPQHVDTSRFDSLSSDATQDDIQKIYVM